MRLPQSQSSRWLVGITLMVLVLVVLSVTVALVRRHEPSLSPEDTPEGTVQRYLLALQEDDGKRAYSYLDSELQEYCDYGHLLDSARRWELRDMRVALEAVEELDEETIVRVNVTETRLSRPFGVSEHTYPARYVLKREEDAWRFSEPPWPLEWCPDWERKIIPEPPVAN